VSALTPWGIRSERGEQANAAESLWYLAPKVSLSSDGRLAAFSSDATNLVRRDRNGEPGGYSPLGAMTFEQGRDGVPGPRRAFEAFGTAVSVLHFDGDRRPDLIIGSPGDHTATVLGGRGPQRPHTRARLTSAASAPGAR